MNHPGGLGRLPSSDLDNSYFRAWALRGSEGSNSSHRAQQPDTPSPKSSPSAGAYSPNRLRKADRQGQLSEPNASKQPLIPTNLQSADNSIPRNVSQSQEDDPAGKARTSSQNSGPSDDRSSSRSSIASRAQKLLSFPQSRKKGSASEDLSSPNETRKSPLWKYETAGHWIEIRIGKKTSATGPPEILEPLKQETATRRQDHPSIIKDSIDAENTNLSPRQRQEKPVHPSPLSANLKTPFPKQTEVAQAEVTTPKTTFFDRTRRTLGFVKHDNEKQDVVFAPTATSEMLEKATASLYQLVDRSRSKDRRLEASSTSTSTSNLSIAAQRWQRLRAGISASEQSSASSDLPSAKPLAPTPEPQALYLGSDQKPYLAIDLTDPGNSTFLPSEARRVTTPPLPKSIRGKKKQLRGFFFDYTPPQSPGALSVGTPSLERGPQPQLGRKASGMDWYRAKLEAIDAEEVEESPEEFVLSVPEHLPNSPLCPRHPKNESGGKGVCVYHGRNTSEVPTTNRLSFTDGTNGELS